MSFPGGKRLPPLPTFSTPRIPAPESPSSTQMSTGVRIASHLSVETGETEIDSYNDDDDDTSDDRSSPRFEPPARSQRPAAPSIRLPLAGTGLLPRPEAPKSVRLMIANDQGEETTQHIHCKLAVLGDHGVGKTTLLRYVMQDKFDASIQPSTGLNVFTKGFSFPHLEVTLDMWDASGSVAFNRSVGNFLYDARVILLCYDVTNYQSFLNIRHWYCLVSMLVSEGNLPVMVLMGLKVDDVQGRVVSEHEHATLCFDLGDIPGFLVSSKSDEGVDACFTRIAGQCVRLRWPQRDLQGDLKALRQHSRSTFTEKWRALLSRGKSSNAEEIGRSTSSESRYLFFQQFSEAMRKKPALSPARGSCSLRPFVLGGPETRSHNTTLPPWRSDTPKFLAKDALRARREQLRGRLSSRLDFGGE